MRPDINWGQLGPLGDRILGIQGHWCVKLNLISCSYGFIAACFCFVWGFFPLLLLQI